MRSRAPSIPGLLWQYLCLRLSATRTSTRLLLVLASLLTVSWLTFGSSSGDAPAPTGPIAPAATAPPLGTATPATAADTKRSGIGPAVIGTRPSEGSHQLDPTEELPRGSHKILGCDLRYRDIPANSGGVEVRWVYRSGQGEPEEIHRAWYALSGSGTLGGNWVGQKRGSPAGSYTCVWRWSDQQASARLRVR